MSRHSTRLRAWLGELRPTTMAVVLFFSPQLCPLSQESISFGLTHSLLSEEQLGEVKKLRAEGEQQYKAGEHTKSVDTLGKAMGILGMN